jgi:NDP-sugar pyrophosphorylase family protein
MGPAVIGSGCKIDQKAYIKGPVVIGPDCHIGENTSIEKSVLWRGVDTGIGTTVRKCILGADTKIKDKEQVSNCVIIAKELQNGETVDI